MMLDQNSPTATPGRFDRQPWHESVIRGVLIASAVEMMRCKYFETVKNPAVAKMCLIDR